MSTNISNTFMRLLPPKVVEQAATTVGSRLLAEYGAIFAAGGGAIPPDRIVFENESEVSEFQEKVDVGRIEFGSVTIELQSVAADALANAVAMAEAAGLSISPRSADSGRRNYQQTIELWSSRVEPALDHWLGKQRINVAEADRIRSLSPFEQVPIVLDLEERGIYFSKDLSKSILYSVAPPGASQHLSMLAFDVAEFNDPAVRKILADTGWFQTVTSDLPHFTYLGLREDQLAERGLKKVISNDREFWVPDI
jgi:hypothetical protein